MTSTPNHPAMDEELWKIKERVHLWIGDAYSVTVGPGTKTDSLDYLLDSLISAHTEQRDTQIKIDILDELHKRLAKTNLNSEGYGTLSTIIIKLEDEYREELLAEKGDKR